MRAGAQTASGYTYYNLTLSGSGAKTTTGITVNGYAINGRNRYSLLLLQLMVPLLLCNIIHQHQELAGSEWVNTFSASGGVIITNTGVITLNAAKVFNLNVPLTINNGASLNTSAANNYGLTFGGDFINNGGTLTANASPVTITSTMATSKHCRIYNYRNCFDDKNRR